MNEDWNQIYNSYDELNTDLDESIYRPGWYKTKTDTIYLKEIGHTKYGNNSIKVYVWNNINAKCDLFKYFMDIFTSKDYDVNRPENNNV